MITLNFWINEVADMPVCKNGEWLDLETGFYFSDFVASEKAAKHAAKAEKMSAAMAKTMRGEKLAMALGRRDSLLKGQTGAIAKCENEKALSVMREAVAALTALDKKSTVGQFDAAFKLNSNASRAFNNAKLGR
jgi:hypothetical protein